jgi:hypothetical protein
MRWTWAYEYRLAPNLHVCIGAEPHQACCCLMTNRCTPAGMQAALTGPSVLIPSCLPVIAVHTQQASCGVQKPCHTQLDMYLQAFGACGTTTYCPPQGLIVSKL